MKHDSQEMCSHDSVDAVPDCWIFHFGLRRRSRTMAMHHSDRHRASAWLRWSVAVVEAMSCETNLALTCTQGWPSTTYHRVEENTLQDVNEVHQGKYDDPPEVHIPTDTGKRWLRRHTANLRTDSWVREARDRTASSTNQYLA